MSFSKDFKLVIEHATHEAKQKFVLAVVRNALGLGLIGAALAKCTFLLFKAKSLTVSTVNCQDKSCGDGPRRCCVNFEDSSLALYMPVDKKNADVGTKIECVETPKYWEKSVLFQTGSLSTKTRVQVCLVIYVLGFVWQLYYCIKAYMNRNKICLSRELFTEIISEKNE